MTRSLAVRRLLAASLLVLLATACATAPRAPGPRALARPAVEVGQPYGPLHLPTVDGSRTLNLAGLHGGKVLLIEFASW